MPKPDVQDVVRELAWALATICQEMNRVDFMRGVPTQFNVPVDRPKGTLSVRVTFEEDRPARIIL